MRALILLGLLIAFQVQAQMVQIESSEIIAVADKLREIRQEQWNLSRNQTRYDELFIMEQMLRKVQRIPDPEICETEEEEE